MKLLPKRLKSAVLSVSSYTTLTQFRRPVRKNISLGINALRMTAQFSATLLEQQVTQKVSNFHIKIFFHHATQLCLMSNSIEKNLTLVICHTLIRSNRYLLSTAL
jgi:hypothetical protein